VLQKINLECNSIRDDLISQIHEILKRNMLETEIRYRKFICAFSKDHEDLVRLRFDKMILRFLSFPIMGLLLDNLE
jgi:methionyl-tRNA synthetase